jgi:group I intron endonuclease
VKKKYIVYQAKNLINGKLYIGITGSKLEVRMQQHDYRRKKLENLPFYNALNKYGLEGFRFSIIYSSFNKEKTFKKEQYYIKKLNTKAPKGYNATDGGEGANGAGGPGFSIISAAAARDIKCHPVSIMQVLLGNSVQVKGYSFKDIKNKYTKRRKTRRKEVAKFYKELKVKTKNMNKRAKQRKLNVKNRKTSKYVGVSYRKDHPRHPWCALKYKGKTSTVLGYFKTEKEAAAARNRA